MTEIGTVDPGLLEQLQRAPFITAEPGDTVILAIDGSWEMEQVESLGTHLMEWNDTVQWRAIHSPGFAGVIHIKAPSREPLILPSTTE